MQKLPNWVIANHFPAIHDFESLTVLEQTARIYGAMNTFIEEFTAFSKELSERVSADLSEMEQKIEVYGMSLRQEFQDFIDVVELQLAAQEKAIANLSEDMEDITKQIVNSAIANGKLYVVEEYDAETEELKLIVNGGV